MRSCRDCSYREWDGVENVCTLYKDEHTERPHVELASAYHPKWCPLDKGLEHIAPILERVLEKVK